MFDNKETMGGVRPMIAARPILTVKFKVSFIDLP